MPPKNSGTFSYPGSKTTIAPWIIQHIPQHDVYVEPFGGSAAVLMRKPESPVEVYNDTNSDCVAFFEAVKRHPDELAEWVRNTPHSRELFERWRDEEDRPDDVVERAGRFFYLAKTSFGGKFETWAVTKSVQNEASYYPTKWQRAAEQVHHLRDRFHNVQVEHLDYQAVVDKYDAPDTFFYCDPPYVDVGDGYYETAEGGFDHTRFVDTLHEIEGKWLVSYGHELPPGLDKYHTTARDKVSTLSVQLPDGVETLTANYDIDGEPVMSGVAQTTLADGGFTSLVDRCSDGGEDLSQGLVTGEPEEGQE